MPVLFPKLPGRGESKEFLFLWCEGCPRHTAAFLRRSASSAPGPRPARRFKPGGAASHRRPCPPANAPSRQLRRPRAARFVRLLVGCEEQQNSRGPPVHAAGPHPGARPRHAHARRNAAATHTHDAGRAGGWARRVGSAGGLGASVRRRRHGGLVFPLPLTGRAIDVQARGARGPEGATGEMHDARHRAGGGGGLAVVGRSGGAGTPAPRSVRIGLLSARVTGLPTRDGAQGRGGRAGGRADEQPCDAAPWARTRRAGLSRSAGGGAALRAPPGRAWK